MFSDSCLVVACVFLSSLSSTSSKLEFCVRARLEGLVPYLSAWPAALAIVAQPHLAPTSVAKAAQHVDDIWHLCGDKTTDVSAAQRIAATLDNTTPAKASWSSHNERDEPALTRSFARVACSPLLLCVFSHSGM